ncbi:MAG: winged helix-turn-helix domain-containing protein [Chloroflexi bacterium]|nr:winged helix-turn-helix domain-containing protein [Chloroflexota bacterium]
MARLLSDLLAQRAADTFVGREAELEVLRQTLEPDGPLVVFVHGVAGIGKSSLLEAFSHQARPQGATVVRLDCRAIEPTERGFLRELCGAIGCDARTASEAAERLGDLGERIVLALDTYEVFRLLDTWLRQVFVPSLAANVRVVLAGRMPPGPGWLAPQWHGLCRSLLLGPLSDEEATALLARAAVGEQDAQRIKRVARGHPLALELAASAVTERKGLALEEAVIQRVVEELSRMYLSDVEDPVTHRALEAASAVRRGTLSLLRAMLPDVAPQDAYERLRALPFVESTRDGLHIHDAVQEAVSGALRAGDPTRYRDLRRAAWRQLRSEVRTAGLSELWRYTADILYLLENPVLREAFFPTGSQEVTVEPARSQDDEAIRAIARRHEGIKGAESLMAWWQRVPESFSVIRDVNGAVAGFYCMFDPATVSRSFLDDDPIARSVGAHLQAEPMPRGQRALLIRRWLDQEQGEQPSPNQAACWLDCKRTYMEMRPHLRRVYGTLNDMATYGATFQKLGFTAIPRPQVELDGRTYWIAVLDMGSASVDGWLSRLVGAELGIEESDLLDAAAGELVLEGQRVRLTRLELAVMDYLYQREGKLATRQALLEDVWGYDYLGGSNVVDAVIRLLRKKLGSQAAAIETVTGMGYRFRRG